MQGTLTKLVTTLGGLATVVVLAALCFDGSPTRAQETYPTWDDYKDYPHAPCNTNIECIVCPKDQTVVYGADDDSPEEGYGQGSCLNGYPGASTTCRGTYWKCERLQCQYGVGDDPPKYQYKGNWCKTL